MSNGMEIYYIDESTPDIHEYYPFLIIYFL